MCFAFCSENVINAMLSKSKIFSKMQGARCSPLPLSPNPSSLTSLHPKGQSLISTLICLNASQSKPCLNLGLTRLHGCTSASWISVTHNTTQRSTHTYTTHPHSPLVGEFWQLVLLLALIESMRVCVCFIAAPSVSLAGAP